MQACVRTGHQSAAPERRLQVAIAMVHCSPVPQQQLCLGQIAFHGGLHDQSHNL